MPWAAVHVRAFVCKHLGKNASFALVRAALRAHSFTSGLLYIVSSIPIVQAQQALPEYEVVSKDTFLAFRVMLSYPFEVCAAIDYGVAVQAPLYIGNSRFSSFDAFASEERRRKNLSGMLELDHNIC